jgi:hypothetical protein
MTASRAGFDQFWHVSKSLGKIDSIFVLTPFILSDLEINYLN